MVESVLDDDLGPALTRFLNSLPARPLLLGLGEPMHGEEEFLRMRNRVFQTLVEHERFRSIAIESDCLAGLAVDTYVGGGPGSLDEVMAIGFSHGFGASAANRELIAWMHSYNAGRPALDRLRFDGFDAPVEMMFAASPRRPLDALRTYLVAHVDPALLPGDAAAIDRLTGADARWTDPAATMDPSRSVGDSTDARALRLLADDLAALVEAQAPGLIAATSLKEWERARLHARAATGLLRYHAGMADPSGSRTARLLGQRDAMMAANLHAIAEREASRGPTLVFAHNAHLQKVPSTWELAGIELQWWSAGAITAATAGTRYAFLATALGSAPAHGLGPPASNTLEAVLASRLAGLCAADEVAALLRGSDVVARTDTSADHGYFPINPDHLNGADGVVFVREV